MDHLPKRRSEDKFSRRAARYIGRLFAVIGFMMVFSLTMMAISINTVAGGPGEKPLPDKILLAFTFDKDLVEVASKPSLNNLSIRPPATLHDVTDALSAAQTDDRVKGFVAHIEGVSLSPAQIQELRSAIAKFRAAGKFANVYTEDFGDLGSGIADYYLATAFDKIWLQPVGSVSVTGLMLQVPFFKGFFDKLGVSADFIHKGIYKSAPESLTATGMSAPTRKNMTSILSDLAGQAYGDIAAARHMTPDQVKALIDNAPYTDRESLKAGLIDHIGYADQAIDQSRQQAGLDPAPAADGKAAAQDDSGKIPMVNLLRYGRDARKLSRDADDEDEKIAMMSRLLGDKMPKAFSDKGGKKIALIYGAGEIVPYEDSKSVMGEGGMQADKISRAFGAAMGDKNVLAIVLRIDSPGGSPAAAETIRRAIERAQAKGKPVIVSMGSYAASGGYWVASAADKIIAQPATLTGSIGVFGGKFVIDGLLQKAGVNFETLTSGEHGAIMSMTRPFSDSERARFNVIMGGIYDAFLDRVAQGRHMTHEQAEQVAEGRVWTGRQAKEKGLVDGLGGLDRALEEARAIAKVGEKDNVRVVRFPPRQSTVEMLISLVTGGVSIMPLKIDAQTVIDALGLTTRAQLQAPAIDIR